MKCCPPIAKTSILRYLVLAMYLAIFIVQSSAQNFSHFAIPKLIPDACLSQGSNYYGYKDKLGIMWITCNDAINTDLII